MAENVNPNWDIGKLLQEAIELALKQRGTVNILIAGKTGVGKSTLVNAVFQGNIATTGQGESVTRETREYKKKGIPVTLLDTRGLELKGHAKTFRKLRRLVIQRCRDTDPDRHIHVAWLCIIEDSRRVEEPEKKLVAMLADYMPVIGVITKARSDNGFRNTVQRMLPQACNVVRVRALAEKLDDGAILPPMGLVDLVELTMEVVPDGQKNAFAAAQKVSLIHKVNRGHKIVAATAVTAAGIGATPIPFSDAAALVPLQVSMLAAISVAFGIPVTRAFLSTMISGAMAGGIGVFAGRAIVAGLFKLIPGAGTVVGGVIAATTAATLTTTFGEAYIGALRYLLRDDPSRELMPEDIAEAFKEQLSMKEGSVEQ